MSRVHVICEGQTEEMFVNELLAPYFLSKNIYLSPALIGKPGHKGGNFKLQRLENDVEIRLLGDRSSYCTTFFDYYGLPSSFPGKGDSQEDINIDIKAANVEEAMTAVLTKRIGEDAMRRFIPYVQMYEFEALLFSDPEAFAISIAKPELIQELSDIASAFESPEHINDSPQTAPSKRLENLIRGYEKPLMGSLGALEVGLKTMRERCLLFDSWLQRLEELPQTN